MTAVQDAPVELHRPFDAPVNIQTATRDQMANEIHRLRGLVAAGAKRLSLVQEELQRVQRKSLRRRDTNVDLRKKNVLLLATVRNLTKDLVVRDQIIERLEAERETSPEVQAEIEADEDE